jgi:hypothetical protein
VRTFRTLLAVVSLAVAAACSHGNATETSSRTGPPPRATRMEKGYPYPLFARAKSSKEIDPDVWSGEEAFITDAGIVPKTLIAKTGAVVLFINESKRTKRITFVNGSWSSGEIRPGTSASYEPTSAITIRYGVAGEPSEQATLYVEPYYQPGETPPGSFRGTG